MNGFSDHNAQYVLIYDTDTLNSPSVIKNIRKINKSSFVDFIYDLSHETLDEVFTDNDVNSLFNPLKTKRICFI
jgi:hypothetical protein